MARPLHRHLVCVFFRFSCSVLQIVGCTYNSFHWKCYIPDILRIAKLRFLVISRYKFKLKFWPNLHLYREIWVSGFLCEHTQTLKTGCEGNPTRIWTFEKEIVEKLPFFSGFPLPRKCTIGNTSVVGFMVRSPKTDMICVQTFAATCCNSGIGRYRHWEVASNFVWSNLGTRNRFCFSDVRYDDFLTY